MLTLVTISDRCCKRTLDLVSQSCHQDPLLALYILKRSKFPCVLKIKTSCRGPSVGVYVSSRGIISSQTDRHNPTRSIHFPREKETNHGVFYTVR